MGNLQEELIRTGLHKPTERAKDDSNTKSRKKPKERLTDRELAELMGTNKDRFRRVKGGAYRRR